MNKRSIVVIVVILISILLCSCLHDNRYPELTKYIKDNTEFRCFQSYIRENDNFAVFQFVDIENTQDMDEIIRAYNVYITENNDYFSNDVNGVELLFYVGITLIFHYHLRLLERKVWMIHLCCQC